MPASPDRMSPVNTADRHCLAQHDDLVPAARAAVRRLAYSPAQGAAALGVCRATIYNLMNRGELRFTKIGRSTRIPVTEIERLSGIAGPGAA